jgi:glycosyltransferase involved in cell wall biosynthesis
LKISIALCTYNAEKYLPDQLESFTRQTRQPDEIVVCDDLSHDSTLQILERFKQDSPFPVRIFPNEKNLGMIKNFEKVISLCEGDIICPSDSDDVWAPDKLQVFEEHFAGPEVGLVFSDAAIADENLRDTGAGLWESANFTGQVKKDFAEGRAFDRLLNDGWVFGACSAFRADLRNVILPIPDDIYYIHDNWIALAAASLSAIELVEKPLLTYRHHQDQLSAGAHRIQGPIKTVINSVQRKNPHAGVIKQLKILEERLIRLGLGSETNRKKIAEAIKHKEFREGLPAAFPARLGKVIAEFSHGAYHKYSNGTRSFIKDIFLFRPGAS